MMNVKFSNILSWFSRQNSQLLHEKCSFNHLYTFLQESFFLSFFEAHNYMHSCEQQPCYMSTIGIYLSIYITECIHNYSDDNLTVALITMYKIGFYNFYIQISILYTITRTARGFDPTISSFKVFDVIHSATVPVTYNVSSRGPKIPFVPCFVSLPQPQGVLFRFTTPQLCPSARPDIRLQVHIAITYTL